MMKSLTFLLLGAIVSGGYGQSATPDGSRRQSRVDWVRWAKINDAKNFATRYGWINFTDGIDQGEALAIANLYFHSTGDLCGMVFEPKKVGEKWNCRFALGYAGSPQKPIWVDAKTGSVWQEGGDRI